MISGILELLRYEVTSIGGTPITPQSFIIFALIIIFTFIASKWIRKILARSLKKRNLDKGQRHPILKLTHYIIIVLGIYIAFNFIGFPLTGLLAAAGIIGIVLGFGLQSITSNMISGILLMGEGSVRVGDVVEIGDKYGEVTDTGIRATTVKSFDNLSTIIPNQEFFTKPFTNYSYKESNIRITVPIGVAYGSDIDKVKKILIDIANNNDKVLKKPEPIVFFTSFGDSALNFELKCWIGSPILRKRTLTELNYEINKRFDEENISIPFPQRDVWMRGED